MRKLLMALAASALGVVAAATPALADEPAPKTFVAVLDAANEVPHCTSATNAARGVAVFHVIDEATGTVEYVLVANNLPGTPIAAHIHIAPAGVPGPVLQPLHLMPGAENGVVARGTFVNPALLVAIRANANESNYYVNVHSNSCPAGVIRGQLGSHGP
jgi:hypothetical protein